MLHAMYKLLGRDPEASLSAEHAMEVVFSCLVVYMSDQGHSISELSRERVAAILAEVEKQPKVASGIRSLVGEVQAEYHPDEIYGFTDAERVMEIAAERMGHRVDDEACQSM